MVKGYKGYKGYKGFKQDLTCRGFQYEIGKTYEYDGDIELCRQGFHFCRELRNVHDFYNLKQSRICEIVADGKIEDDGIKSVCSRISIVRELSREEIDAAVNTGEGNTGVFNSGNRNSGDDNSGNRNSGHGNSGSYNSGHGNSGNYNSGDGNSGNRNSGDGNSGNRNSGHGNSGNYNSGDGNSGNRNSGNYNSGNRNSGHDNSGHDNSGHGNSGNYNSGHGNSGNYNSGNFCSCDHSSGIFMTKKITYEAFNKQLTKEEYDALIESEGFSLLQHFRLYSFKARTEKDGQKHIVHLSYKAIWRMFWQTLTPEQKLTIKRMPHFDADVFYEITGIRLGKLHREEK